MKIISWHGGAFSEQSGRRLVELVSNAQGRIVLPLTEQEVKDARQIASDPHERTAFAKNSLHLTDPYFLAIWAMGQGKEVSHLRTKAYDEIARRWGHLARNLDALPSGANADAYMLRQLHAAEAQRALHQFERFRNDKPALILAEETTAAVLGRMFRTRPTYLTKPSREARRLARKIAGHAIRLI